MESKNLGMWGRIYIIDVLTDNDLNMSFLVSANRSFNYRMSECNNLLRLRKFKTLISAHQKRH